MLRWHPTRISPSLSIHTAGAFSTTSIAFGREAAPQKRGINRTFCSCMSRPVSGQPAPAMYNLHLIPTTGSEQCQRVISQGYTVGGCGVDLAATRRGMRNDKELDFKNLPFEEWANELKCSAPFHEVDIFLNCFDMLSEIPAEELKPLEKHCGEHTAITQMCICSDKFAALVTDCRDLAQELWMTKSNIEVVCCCSDGWHASVAMASILQHLFAVHGYNAVGPIHLSNSTCWSEMCSYCSECIPNQEKTEMLSAVQASLHN